MVRLAAAAVPLLAAWGRRWVAHERAIHRPDARPVAGAARTGLAPFYLAETLDAVRVRVVSRLAPPAPVQALRRLGVRIPLEFERIQGITFADTVVVLDRVPPPERVPLLFHECVHVVQYRLLGVGGFVERYVGGWLDAGRRYADIPLERDAYALTRRFVVDPGAAFAVEAEVARRLGR